MGISLEGRIFPRWLMAVFALAVLGIVAGGTGFYFFQERQLQRTVDEELLTIGETKINQIVQWRASRIEDAGEIMASPFYVEKLAAWMSSSPPSAETTAQVLARFKGIQDYHHCQNVVQVDAQGTMLLSLRETEYPHDAEIRREVAKAIETHQPVLTDLRLLPHSQMPHVDVIAPLFKQDAQAIGATIMCFDPEDYLFPLLQAWPVPSQTAESLLVRREGDSVIFLNELRHKRHTALKLSIPLDKRDVPAAMAARGRTGIVEGVDYRGESVVAAIHPVPDSSWYLVSKMDKTEAFSAWRLQSFLILGLIIVLVFAAFLITGMFWMQGRRAYYKALYQGEMKHQALLKHFEYLVKHANDMILLADKDGHIVEANNRALTQYGHTREEMLRLNIADLVAPEDRRAYKDRMREMEIKGSFLREALHRRKDGSTFPVEVSARCIEVEGKWYIQEIMRDITERKRGEQALAESEERYRSLVEQTTDIIWRIDGNGLLTYLSPAVEILLGYPPEELIGQPFSVILAPESVEAAWRTVGLTAYETRVEKSKMGEYLHRRKDGTTFVGETRSAPVLDCQGFLIGVQGITRDVTQRKRLEEQLIQAQKMESMGRLAGGVAHDFNNLLAIIMGYAEMASSNLPKDSPQRGELNDIIEAAMRAKELTGQLLAFSRKQVLEMKEINLNNVLLNTEKMVRRIIGEDIQIHMSLEPQAGLIQADSAQMVQVVMNLCVNARDAMPKGGTITLATQCVHLSNKRDGLLPQELPSGEYMRFTVSDTGCGMNEAVRSRIFEPFFTTKEAGQGTGLGLAMVFGIVKQHGGDISVYSEPGHGTTFRVYLPLITAASQEKDQEKLEASPLHGLGETVLVMEDDASLYRLVNQMLTRLEYTVVKVKDMEECIECIRNGLHIDLLLTDVIMPGLNGRQVYERIAEISPDVKVLFMSGYTDDIIAHCGILGNRIHFISKPFTEVELGRKLREALLE
ncbi:MAG TPA: PAS domain S-box protein [Candidatus Hydrogenedentes bacterium]|nr:PAS domain S-box protein [Candidatus Hydrogenedentota bacterium]